MKLLVNDLKLYFGLMFLLPLTLAGHKLHGVLFAHGLVHGFHWAASFPFFHAKKFKIPRSWPS